MTELLTIKEESDTDIFEGSYINEEIKTDIIEVNYNNILNWFKFGDWQELL